MSFRKSIKYRKHLKPVCMALILQLSASYAGAEADNRWHGMDTLFVGDSIAVGYGHGFSTKSIAVSGLSPKKILETQVMKLGPKVRGMNIILSSGISNNITDFANVERQIAELKRNGAYITLLGVADNYKGSRAKGAAINGRLAQIADKYGIAFLGGFEAVDAVHPKDTGRLPDKW